jgi:hypothetical protein
MEMVGHDGESVDAPATAKRRSTEVFYEPIMVDIIAYDDLTAVAACHDVIDRIGVLEPESSCHATHNNRFGVGSQVKT